jgi:hypothetical protein
MGAGGCFGSSVDTAMTAAAVSDTTMPPRRTRPIRAARLRVSGLELSAGRLRIGRRPATTSWAVYTWNVTAASSGTIEGEDH